MPKIATPISHLFQEEALAHRVREVSDCLECRDRSFDDLSPNQALFHCELQPIHVLEEEDFNYLKKIQKNKKELELITFHMATCCTEPVLDCSHIKSGMFQAGGTLYTREKMLQNAKENFKKIKSIFGDNVKIAVENNNYYPTEAYQFITDADFISQVVSENGLYFLFDIAHAQVTSHNKGVDFRDYKSKLPLNRVVQLHICSPDIDDTSNLAYDAHNYPDEFKLNEVKNLISQYAHIEYLTVEYYRDIDNLIKSINTVKELL
jgi:uncharacterized protein (UPF0276 family)